MKNSLTATEFSAVFEKGRTVFHFPIKLIATESPSVVSFSAIKTGFAVPKRMVKKAIHRNRLKRQMRAAFQKHENVLRGTFLDASKDYNLIFMYSGKKSDITFALIEEAICNNVKALADSFKQ